MPNVNCFTSSLEFSQHFNGRTEASLPVSSIVFTRRVNQFSWEDMGGITGVHTISAREGTPFFCKNQGSIGGPSRSQTRSVDRTLVNLPADEWIVRVSGTSNSAFLTSFAVDTNKGRQFAFTSVSSSEQDYRFEMLARENEALYGFDAYSDFHEMILRPKWHTAPVIPCTADTCLSREANPVLQYPAEFCPGIRAGAACCPSSCGQCGGSGCSRHPGGANSCCTGNILRAEDFCSSVCMAPCLVGSELRDDS